VARWTLALPTSLAELPNYVSRPTPPEVVIGNHVFHLLELAALHLSASPPQLAHARLTIDAVAGLLHEVSDRIGEHGPLLNEALAQIQLAFVHVAQAQTNNG
jgi:hypothetical protein